MDDTSIDATWGYPIPVVMDRGSSRSVKISRDWTMMMADAVAQTSPAQALIPYTGFYTLDPEINSFIMIDTHEVWNAPAIGGIPTIEYFGTITLSPDGVSSTKFEIGNGATFSGTNLAISGEGGEQFANLAFSAPATVTGTMYGVQVAGTSPFGPVMLPTWTGTYYKQLAVEHHGGLLHYPYAPTLQVNADGSMLYSLDSGTLEPVSSYWYDYGMFVIGLMGVGTPNNQPKLYEMGTSSGWGRVAGDAETGVMLVSLKLQEPAPHL